MGAIKCGPSDCDILLLFLLIVSEIRIFYFSISALTASPILSIVNGFLISNDFFIISPPEPIIKYW
jgi:hypothetical protein